MASSRHCACAKSISSSHEHTAALEFVQIDGWIVQSMWQAPHRPLFLFAGLWALVTPAIWLVPDRYGLDPASWHFHELMFGMGGAAVGGYLLTALPAWSKAGGVSPLTTLALAALWCVARFSFVQREALPFPIFVAGILAYFAFLGAFLARQLLCALLWRKTWVIAAVGGLGLLDLLLIAPLVDLDGNEVGIVAALLFALLISLIGGRAVPAFTRHWLERQKAAGRVAEAPGLVWLSVGVLVVGIILVGAAAPRSAGVCLALSGALHLVRIAGWRSLHTIRYPALLVLHLAWIWLPLGLLLVGFAMLRPALMGPSAALHALTMGLMGTMMLAIMARPAMRRREGVLLLGSKFALAFALVWFSALIRVLGPVLAVDPLAMLPATVLIWMSGWMLFLYGFLPALRGPVIRPVLSASAWQPPGKTGTPVSATLEDRPAPPPSRASYDTSL